MMVGLSLHTFWRRQCRIIARQVNRQNSSGKSYMASTRGAEGKVNDDVTKNVVMAIRHCVDKLFEAVDDVPIEMVRISPLEEEYPSDLSHQQYMSQVALPNSLFGGMMTEGEMGYCHIAFRVPKFVSFAFQFSPPHLNTSVSPSRFIFPTMSYRYAYAVSPFHRSDVYNNPLYFWVGSAFRQCD